MDMIIGCVVVQEIVTVWDQTSIILHALMVVRWVGVSGMPDLLLTNKVLTSTEAYTKKYCSQVN